MAHYYTTFLVPTRLEDAFAYVSDFRHAVWDPRVISARKVDSGPIGVGTSFVLVTPLFWGCTIDLPYKIVVYEPPHRLVFVGETAIMSYRDEITFALDGDATQITYNATMTLKGGFKIGNPILSLKFQRIGDDATRGLKKALEDRSQAS